MSTILAIDTSLAACSVALKLPNATILQQSVVKPRAHAELILPMVNELLHAAQIKLADINAIAFGCGPASFTGIRIAASVAQGLAFAHKISVIPVSTLQAIAQTIYREKAVTQALIILDAYMAEVYFGAYALNNKIMSPVGDELLLKPAAVAQVPEFTSYYGVGDAWQLYRDILLKQTGIAETHIIPEQYPQAYDIAELGHHYYQAGKIMSALSAQPVYLREKSAWHK